jgi:hypothetical protein
MDSRYLRFIPIGPPMLLHELTTPPFVEEARTILQKHGCTFKEYPEKCIIYFPEGTTRTEETLRTHSEHYRIQLPDGYILHESYDWWRKISFLQYSPE